MPKATKIQSHNVIAQQTHTHELSQKPDITYEEERVALVFSLAVGFAAWHMFQCALNSTHTKCNDLTSYIHQYSITKFVRYQTRRSYPSIELFSSEVHDKGDPT